MKSDPGEVPASAFPQLPVSVPADERKAPFCEEVQTDSLSKRSVPSVDSGLREEDIRQT
jgi:hypothetical protein